MKIHQLISGLDIPVTNEEHKFIENHRDNITISSLDDHDQWLAQNLTRRGIYSISKDNSMLIPKSNEKLN